MKDELTPALNKMIKGQFLNRGIAKIAQKVKTKAKKNIMKRGKYNSGVISNTGDLAKSIQSERKGFAHYNVKVTEPYGVFVHEGTRPHYPPFKPISEWVARKLKVKNNPANYLITRAIVRKIGAKGTEAKPFLKDAMAEEAAEKNFKKVIENELKKELDSYGS